MTHHMTGRRGRSLRIRSSVSMRIGSTQIVGAVLKSQVTLREPIPEERNAVMHTSVSCIAACERTA